jgi:integrase
MNSDLSIMKTDIPSPPPDKPQRRAWRTGACCRHAGTPIRRHGSARGSNGRSLRAHASSKPTRWVGTSSRQGRPGAHRLANGVNPRAAAPHQGAEPRRASVFDKTGLEDGSRASALRHTHATWLGQKGRREDRSGQRSLGHADISTTPRYRHVKDPELLEALREGPSLSTFTPKIVAFAQVKSSA